jgi:hypothetical protein
MSVRLRVALAVAALLTAGLTTPSPAPAATGRYRVSIGIQPSTELAARPVAVTGGVAPRAPGQAVKLQVSTGTGWHTVAVARLGRHSRYAATFTPSGVGTYQLRVRKPANHGHRRGTSAAATLTVTPSLPPS